MVPAQFSSCFCTVVIAASAVHCLTDLHISAHKLRLAIQFWHMVLHDVITHESVWSQGASWLG